VAALENYLANFEVVGGAWPAFISSAFPRFHDVYQPAGVRDYWGYLGDRRGEILRMTLSRAMTNQSAMVQLVTWNDFGEGTVIEPTSEFGYRDLGIVQDCRRQYLDPGFACRTNDLVLATRLYRLRRASASDARQKNDIDAVFTDIVKGNLAEAGRRLTVLESKK
jgi:hypothetical protein